MLQALTQRCLQVAQGPAGMAVLDKAHAELMRDGEMRMRKALGSP